MSLLPPAQNTGRSTSPLRLVYSLSLLILLLSVILAAPRAVPRISLLGTQLQSFTARVQQYPLFVRYSTFKPTSSIPPFMMDKYKKPPQAPPTFIGTKENIVSDTKALCDKTRSMLDKLVAEIPANDSSKTTFENVILPQIYDENQSALSSRILGFYQYVSSDAELRDASTEAEKILDEFGIETSMREDVFKIVDAVFQKKDTLGLDPESLRLLEKERKSYIRNGLSLPEGPKRDRFKEIKKRLSQIQIQFQKNLNEENGALYFTKEELDGLPSDLVETWEKGTGANENKYRVSFKYPGKQALRIYLWPRTRPR